MDATPAGTRAARAAAGREDTGHVGRRIRTERLRCGLTQSALADGQYTKAYISALEHGLIRPSVAALGFLAGRLGLTAAELLADDGPRWGRLRADIDLARGRYDEALAAYEALLGGATDDRSRAELLAGIAEACARLDRGRDAVRAAAEAGTLFARLGRQRDRLWAMYWQASGLYQSDNADEASRLLAEIRAAVDGDVPDPELAVRALIAAAMIESRESRASQALSFLEAARSRVPELDPRRRASFHLSLSISYHELGDLEAAIRAGSQALAYFRAAEIDQETARLENELALVFLELGNTKQASQRAASARALTENLGDDRLLAHVAETQGQIALARGDAARALALSDEARSLAGAVGNQKALVSALLLAGGARRASGDPAGATETLETAAAAARDHGRGRQLTAVLTELAEIAAEGGDMGRAYELSREALSNPS